MRARPLLRLLLPTAACLGLGAALAASPPASTAARPVITVSADQSSALSQPHGERTQVTYSGHVVIRRGTLTLRGAQAVVHTNSKGIERVVVTGKPARFTLAPSSGTGIHGEAASITYTDDDQLLTLDGRVRLTRPGESFSAAHATYSLRTRRLTAGSNGTGRIHAVLTPAGRTAQ